MVQCKFCLNFNGEMCIKPRRKRHKKKFDSWEEMDCPYYLEKEFAG